ncbi:MAG: hypothetical protein R6U40_03420 [Desulfobacterales bacterium]
MRAVTYSAKNPKPITSQSVNTATIIVGVFISQVAPYLQNPGKYLNLAYESLRLVQNSGNSFESALSLTANSMLTLTRFLKYTIKLKDFQGPYVLPFHLKNTKKDFFLS